MHESLEEVRDWLATLARHGLSLDGRRLGMVRAHRVDTDWHVGGRRRARPARSGGTGGCYAPEAGAQPDCRRVLLFTGAKSLRNIDLYHSEGYQSVPLAGPDGTTCLTKDMPLRQR